VKELLGSLVERGVRGIWGSWRGVANLFAWGHLPPAEQLPTFGQYKYWFKKEMDLEHSLISRHGSKRFNLDYRPVLGSSTFESFGPGSRFQIDATVADVYLVSEYKREWIIGDQLFIL